MKNYEYNSLLKQKLEQIKNHNKDIIETINSLSCKDSYKNLYMIFLINLKKMDVSEELYRKVEKIIFNESNVQRTVDEHECIFGSSMVAGVLVMMPTVNWKKWSSILWRGFKVCYRTVRKL